MSTLKVDTIQKADGTGSLSVPAESGTVVTTASPSLGRRNLIINGAMQVAQRGTSFTGLTNGNAGYKLDRWRWAESGTPTSVMTVSQSTDVPTGSGFSSSLKAQCTTAGDGDNYIALTTAIEAQNLQQLAYGTSSAKTMTLSFWVKSNQTGTGCVWFYADDAGRNYAAEYTISSADTWEYKTIVIAGDTAGSITNDNGTGFSMLWGLAVNAASYKGGTANTWGADAVSNRFAGITLDLTTSTSDYFAITGVQLEVGSVATPFEHRSYGEELAACQRYYQRFNQNASSYIRIGAAVGSGTNTGYMMVSLPSVMRTTPTLTSTGLSSSIRFLGGGGSNSVTALTVDRYGSNNNLSVNFTTAAGISAGTAGLIDTGGTTSSDMYLDAEL